MTKTDIKSLPYEELEQWILANGEKKYRAVQLYQWMHQKLAGNPDAMTNLPGSLKTRIRESCVFTVLKQAACQVSAQDGTRKYLFQLADGNMVESVLMRYKHGNSVCISSQAGCRMGCRFCASALDGLVRNLTPAEMLEQVYRISSDIGERISHVVVMGTGEPLDNYENLLVFLRMLTDEYGLNISQRNVTVSTCGLAPKMRALAKEKLQITLALSLHASTQEKRERLMPVAKSYDIQELMDACRYYFEETGRRITFEYSLIAGENDTKEDALELAKLIGNLNCHVNLIPVNPVRERNYRQPDRRAVLVFKNLLEKYQKTVTIRKEMGRDIDGACGQLRRSYAEQGVMLRAFPERQDSQR
ncbi:MAG: 23S rRNA (adenine(2503)-C(2))-methyltransferase RlmN [Clostridiales bacterium]|nr:23S rRNA (adenine(2503)-C(2))-methyltransferase RlmN [Clostridiales bacterium]